MEKAFLMDSSKGAKGMPAFGLPLFSLRFLTNLFLFQIYRIAAFFFGVAALMVHQPTSFWGPCHCIFCSLQDFLQMLLF